MVPGERHRRPQGVMQDDGLRPPEEEEEEAEAGEAGSAMECLSRLVRDLWAPRRVPRLSRAPDSALSFYREFVSPNVPCIFTAESGLLQHWRWVGR